jgi:WD40 repeat protein
MTRRFNMETSFNDYLPSRTVWALSRIKGLPAEKERAITHRLKPEVPLTPIVSLDRNREYLGILTKGASSQVEILSRLTGERVGTVCIGDFREPFIRLTEKNYLLVVSGDHDLMEIHHAFRREPPKLLTFRYGLQGIVSCRNGAGLFVVSRVNLIEEYDLSTGQCIFNRRLRRHTSPVSALATSWDSKLLFTGSAGSGEVFCWEPKTGTLLRTYDIPTRSVYIIAISPDAQRLAVRGIENRISLMNVRTGAVEMELDCGNIHGDTLHFSADGARLLCYNGSGSGLLLWDVIKGVLLTSYSRPKCLREACLAFFMDDDTLILQDAEQKSRLYFLSVADDRPLGTLRVCKEGRLWEIARDESALASPFWTDRPEALIEVVEKMPMGPPLQVLKEGDIGRERYLQQYLDRERVLPLLLGQGGFCQKSRTSFDVVRNRTIAELENTLWTRGLPGASDSREEGP